MVTFKKIIYALFGTPAVVEMGPGVDGQMITVKVQPFNIITIIALVVPFVLFLVFMWFYISPLIRDKYAISARSERPKDIDEEQLDPALDQPGKRSLLAWMHRGSRGRFINTKGNHRTVEKDKDKDTLRPPYFRAGSSFFTRSSLIPNLSPVTPPPPAYGTRRSPLSGSPDRRFPRTRSQAIAFHDTPSPTPASRQPPPVPRICIPSRRISVRSGSGSGPEPAMSVSVSQPVPRRRNDTAIATLRAPLAPRSVSESTLHPSSAHLPIPSRALVYSRFSDSPPRKTSSGNPAVIPADRFVNSPTRSLGDKDRQGTGIGVPF